MGSKCQFIVLWQKWTIHDIIQNRGVHLTKANPHVMMRENLKTKSCEYIAVYMNDLYTTAQFPKYIGNTLKTKCKKEISNQLMVQVE